MGTRRLSSAAICAALLLAAACSGEPDVVARGIVRCRVVLDRELATLPVVQIDKNPEHCGHELQNPLLEVGKREVRDAFVSVEWPHAEPNAAPSEVRLRGKGCLFEPRVLLAREGDFLKIGSGDEFTHNPHGWREDDTTFFNLTILNPTFSFTRRLDRPGTIRVDCDTHKWMRAFVHVTAHPFAALTDEHGVAEFEAPAGRRRLLIRHELLGDAEIEVDVRAGELTEATVNLELSDRRDRALVSPNEGPWTP